MTGQMKKLTGKCPVTDCYCEHCYTHNIGVKHPCFSVCVIFNSEIIFLL